ncbi:MAG: hypothetical protein Q8K65_08725 [Alphaproteobacteria bacterium]|nr:hypothetical protein [Alphaproteobacteria bacterium]
MSEPEKNPDDIKPLPESSPDAPSRPPANSNEALTPVAKNHHPHRVDALRTQLAEEEAPNKKYGWGKKALSITFNIAAGAAAAAAAKAIVAVPMALMSAPAVATLLVSSIAVGAAMTVMCHAGQTYSAKKKGAEGPKFWTKQNRNTFLKSSGFALIGGALFMGFGDALMDKFFGPSPEATPAPVEVKPEPIVTAPEPMPEPAPEEAVVAPIAAPCPTPMESFSTLIDGHTVSDRVTDAIARAGSENARVAAQGAKDLAFFAFNGFDGVPKDPSVAAGLFQQAAEAGNVQAKVDLLYMQYHGLGGVTANPSAAISAMSDIGTPRAEMFVQQWGGADKITERVAFDAKAILSGVKLCPTP